MTELKAGQTYIAKDQGSAITPISVEVTVVWVEDDTVHYRVGSNIHVKQTTKKRFMEIVS